MRNILAIARREIASTFNSPLATIVIGVFLGLLGAFVLFFEDLLGGGVITMRPVFFWAGILELLLAPAVTMRLFAEERRSGSIELLATLPITDAELVLGKFLAAFLLLAMALGLTATYPVSLSMLGKLDLGTVVGGYVGLLLLGAALTAIGTAASAYTSSQVVAFIVALVFCVIPYTIGFALPQVPPVLLPVVQTLAFDTHVQNLARGVVDTRGLVYFVSVVLFALQTAVLGLERRRLA